jgi:putative transposase
LKEHEAGVSVADLCRKHGVGDVSIHKWKATFGRACMFCSSGKAM